LSGLAVIYPQPETLFAPRPRVFNQLDFDAHGRMVDDIYISESKLEPVTTANARIGPAILDGACPIEPPSPSLRRPGRAFSFEETASASAKPTADRCAHSPRG
jgi:hypothetical protein